MPDMHMMDFWFNRMNALTGIEWQMARRRAYQYGFACGWTDHADPIG